VSKKDRNQKNIIRKKKEKEFADLEKEGSEEMNLESDATPKIELMQEQSKKHL